jgi:hypothetical protein
MSGYVSAEQWQANVSKLKHVIADPDMRRNFGELEGVWRESLYEENEKAIAELVLSGERRFFIRTPDTDE